MTKRMRWKFGGWVYPKVAAGLALSSLTAFSGSFARGGNFAFIESAFAEEEQSTPKAATGDTSPSSATPAENSSEPVRRHSSYPKRGRRREQKETEGTEAKGRFESDTILKSQYQLNGQGLEVDTD